jgi:hypothetical protein
MEAGPFSGSPADIEGDFHRLVKIANGIPVHLVFNADEIRYSEWVDEAEKTCSRPSEHMHDKASFPVPRSGKRITFVACVGADVGSSSSQYSLQNHPEERAMSESLVNLTDGADREQESDNENTKAQLYLERIVAHVAAIKDEYRNQSQKKFITMNCFRVVSARLYAIFISLCFASPPSDCLRVN